jgi:hypothetical protein
VLPRHKTWYFHLLCHGFPLMIERDGEKDYKGAVYISLIPVIIQYICAALS